MCHCGGQNHDWIVSGETKKSLPVWMKEKLFHGPDIIIKMAKRKKLLIIDFLLRPSQGIHKNVFKNMFAIPLVSLHNLDLLPHHLALLDDGCILAFL